MTDDQHDRLNSLWAGIQLGIFEVIWPTFRWIEGIWGKKESQVHLLIQVSELPDEESWEDCQRLMKELLDVTARSYEAEFRAGYTIQHSLQAPQDQEYMELISDRIFKRIAEEVAPWRLESGR